MKRYLKISIKKVLVLVAFASVILTLALGISEKRRKQEIAIKAIDVGAVVCSESQVLSKSDLSVNWLGQSEHSTDEVTFVGFLLGSKGDDWAIADFYRLPNLNSLTLNGNGYSDECVDSILKIDNLEELTIGNTYISPYGIEKLSSHSSLRSFSIGQCTPAHLRAIQGFKDLEFLSILDCFGDDDIGDFSKLQSLKRLQLCRSSIELSKVLDQISNLKKLRILDFSGQKFDDKLFSSLQGIPQIEHLSLPSCPLTDKISNDVGKLKSLKGLDLANTFIGNDSLREIAKLPNLERLDISYTKISDISAMSKLSQLRFLSIEGVQIDSQQIKHLATLKQLNHLVISDCVSDHEIKWLKKQLPKCELRIKQLYK